MIAPRSTRQAQSWQKNWHCEGGILEVAPILSIDRD
jgi:hypothetical protein